MCAAAMVVLLVQRLTYDSSLSLLGKIQTWYMSLNIHVQQITFFRNIARVQKEGEVAKIIRDY